MLLCNKYDIMKEQLIQYIKEVVGFQMLINPLNADLKGKLPLYLRDEYQWFEAELEDKKCLFAVVNNENAGGISQLGKHFQKVKEITEMPVVAVFDYLEAYNRKRLIEKKIAFVVPEKQLYIPEFIIDLREYSIATKKKKGALNPLAQQILLLFILDKVNKLEVEQLTFKRLAELLGTNPMGITRAVESLKNQELIDIIGDKEKTIHFIASKRNLWLMAKKHRIFINPVQKRVFVDELPQNINLLRAYDNALTEYTDINPARQEYYAIDKGMFQALKKTNALINENSYEGRYCFEVWKYNPMTINKLLFENNQTVDPLSLLLCYDDNYDERVEMAMEQIENKYLW
jgi:hypothetical protein